MKSLHNIDEAMLDNQASAYADKYPEQIEAYESNSILAKMDESIPAQEIVAMGQQLDQYQNYFSYCESQGNLASLGAIPQVALDVITASVGTSILPLVSSIQPVSEEHSIVYYKQIKSTGTAGGYNAGDVISDPLTRDAPGDGTFGGQNKTEVVDVSANGVLAYGSGVNGAAVLSALPARPFTFKVTTPTLGFAQDDGAGKLIGYGMTGTINYTTGAWTLDLTADPLAVNENITFQYDVDIDAASSLDKIEGSLITKDIKAEIWALAADVGTMASFSFQNRFGRSAIDEVAQDLSNEITRVLNTAAVTRIDAAAVGTTTWDKTPPSTAVSYAEHKATFIDAIAAAETVLHTNSGVGNFNRMMVGKLAASALRGMPEFIPAPAAATVSVGLFGTYNGVPVIRATGVLPDADIILLANPQGFFNAPLAYSPFMPLLVTNTVQSPSNPFQTTQAAAVWSGMTSLNGNLATRLTILNP